MARVVVLDAQELVLLLRYQHHHGTREHFWVPPGGALEQGESHRAAAKRELAEETGLDLQIGRQLWRRQFQLELRSHLVEQFEHYYLARVNECAPVVRNSTSEDILELRWWSLAELRDSQVTLYPEGFADKLAGLVRTTA